MTVNKWLTAKPSKEPDERLLREGGRGGWHLLLVSGFCLVAQLPITPLTATYDGNIIETKAHDQVVIVVCS